MAERDRVLADVAELELTVARLKALVHNLWTVVDYRRQRILFWQGRARAWKRTAKEERERHRKTQAWLDAFQGWLAQATLERR